MYFLISSSSYLLIRTEWQVTHLYVERVVPELCHDDLGHVPAKGRVVHVRPGHLPAPATKLYGRISNYQGHTIAALVTSTDLHKDRPLHGSWTGADTGFWVGWGAKDFTEREARENV